MLVDGGGGAEGRGKHGLEQRTLTPSGAETFMPPLPPDILVDEGWIGFGRWRREREREREEVSVDLESARLPPAFSLLHARAKGGGARLMRESPLAFASDEVPGELRARGLCFAPISKSRRDEEGRGGGCCFLRARARP